MSTAPQPDPFEGDWTPELEEDIRSSFDGLPFELLDDDFIEREVAAFAARLADGPDGVDPFETR